MITRTTNVGPEAAFQSAGYVLFVEGRDQDAIDPTVLRELFQGKIEVEPFGPSSNIKSAAEAFYKHHQTYCFLIDRDHYDDDTVDQYWNAFPDSTKSNLLIWRRREMENYFLIPEYLVRSAFLSVSEDELRNRILKCCNERLYLDCANQVIIQIREEHKNKWIKKYKRLNDFKTKDAAISNLLKNPELSGREKYVAETVHPSELEKRFEQFLTEMTGGQEPLEYDQGKWLKLLPGKEVFHVVVGDGCFKVPFTDSNGQRSYMEGHEKLKEVAKELVMKPLEVQPDDFQKLYQMISNMIARAK
ncbi:MAG: DUF4435 domain-containing protein [Deltaproteobacteria bacterium]|nr:DUF4435 domain-containing protein [Deltaproteobacteria bacterium]